MDQSEAFAISQWAMPDEKRVGKEKNFCEMGLQYIDIGVQLAYTESDKRSIDLNLCTVKRANNQSCYQEFLRAGATCS